MVRNKIILRLFLTGACVLPVLLFAAKTLPAGYSTPNTRKRNIDFSLGQYDAFNAVSARLDLVGRDQELEALLKSYKALSSENGRSRLTIIAGEGGRGGVWWWLGRREARAAAPWAADGRERPRGTQNSRHDHHRRDPRPDS